MTLDLNAIKARVEAILEGFVPFGCTDGYCFLRGHAKGVHTNGGCHCLYRRTLEPRLGNLLGHTVGVVRQDIPALLQEIARLTAERDEAVGVVAKLSRDWTVAKIERDEASSRLARLTAEYAALGKVVKEWQEAYGTCAEDDLRYREARLALADHPLKEET